MSTPKIDTSAVLALTAERAPLWLRYPTQAEAQPAHLVMDADGIVTARIDPEIGNGMPMDIAMGRRLCWRIPGTLTGEQLSNLITDERTVALLERIHAGHAIAWDGSNHRGQLTDDADDADAELEVLCAELEGDARVWDVETWLGDASIEQLWPADMPVEQAAAELQAEAEASGITLEGDLAETLQARRAAQEARS